MAAGYLHDVIEDTSVSEADIQDMFGRDVLQFVLGNTEDMRLSWNERKAQTIKRARVGSLQLKALIAADKYDNISSILKHYDLLGEHVWSVFSKGKEDQYWYYAEISKALFENVEMENIPSFFYDYQKLVEKLRNIIKQ